MSYSQTFDPPVIEGIKKIAEIGKKKQIISYPDMLLEIVKDKKKYEEMCKAKLPRNQRKLFRRALNKKIGIWNDAIKVLKVSPA